jgi:SAM-dependent methyltransferase
MSTSDPATIRFYATEAPDYHASSPGGINCDLPNFLDRLPPDALILELGCGGGRDAEYAESRGFTVEPTDGVPEMAALAEARLGRPVRIMRFDELDAVESYSAVYASYSLLHVPRADLDDVLRRVWTALVPGGWHMATYKSGGLEGRDEYGRYFNYLSADDASRYYRAAGEWELLELTQGEGPGYKGRKSPWVNVIARKPC